jgi:hypothetical protein
MKLLLSLCLGLSFINFVESAPVAGSEDLIVLSSITSPRVSYQLIRKAEGLELTVAVDSFAQTASAPSLEVGVSAAKTLKLSNKDAKSHQQGLTTAWIFTLAEKRLIAKPEDWKLLRFALAVSWPGGPLGQPRLKERFMHTNQGAAHSGLSPDPADWRPMDLEELSREASDRAKQIRFDFQQPMEGKATVVIENVAGDRVRNLLSGQIMAAGVQKLLWDGLDEMGNVTPPGKYRWRAISHPGLTPVHEIDFCDAPGSNHGTLHSATTSGKNLYFAAPVAEGGHEFIELSPEGEFLRGINPPHGHGLGRVAIVANEQYLYAAHDGLAWGVHVDRSKPGWKEERMLSVMRVDLKSGAVAEFADKVRHSIVRKYENGPGSKSKLTPEENALSGLALIDGKLLLADQDAQEVLVIDAETGKLDRTFPLAHPAGLTTRDAELFAISDHKLVKLDLLSGKSTVLATINGKVGDVCASPDGGFWITNQTDQVVQLVDAKGAVVKTIGSPGGMKPGAYDPMKFLNPTGITILNGRVWVTEKDRWQPKRLSAYNAASGAVDKEYFGPTNYGAQGGGFDEQDESRWIGQDALWQLDYKTKTAKPVSVLGGKNGIRRAKFWRQDGRTFLLSFGKVSRVQELRADGTLKQLAFFSSAHQFAYDYNWMPPQAFVDAFNRDYPKVPYTSWNVGGIQSGKPSHGYGMLWVDKDGDGELQAVEIQFATEATSLAGAGWSHDFFDLTMKVPGEYNGKKVLVTLKPDGLWPGGAPKYPALSDALKASTPIDLPTTAQIESMVDRFGNTVLNSDPNMRSFAPDGRLLWTYPNRWSNVHGSHDAPLPTPGEMQGALFFSGSATLDDASDVFLINGNHGRAFVMTTDGLYIDEMFPDVRLMKNPQANGIGILGGECFGGVFGRSDKSGNYYFQGGGISYRIYRIDGLKETKRSQGALTVSAEQSIAAERTHSRKTAATLEPAVTTIPFCSKPPVIDGKDDDWPEAVVAKWDRGGKFPVSVKAAYDGTKLYLHYNVHDQSPWVNNGKDWQALFKTGDGIDLQIGTDAGANPKRSNPVPGDLRLFIAPMGQENVAVVYRHRLAKASGMDSVLFQSPWRSEKVDSVIRLKTVEMRVQKEGNKYRVEVAVPLVELGLENVANLKLRGDFGIIYGDDQGTVNVFRNYWSNQSTGLVNDVPGEIMLSPNLWGSISFGLQP